MADSDLDIKPRQMTPEQAARLNMRMQAADEYDADIDLDEQAISHDLVVLTDIAVSLRMVINALPVEQRKKIVTP